jgi:chaperonin GroES
MKLQPLGNNIVVRYDKPVEKTDSGIYIPQQSQEKNETAEVMAVGPGRKVKGVLKPTVTKVGEQVLIPKYIGTHVKEDGEAYLIITEDQILATVG